VVSPMTPRSVSPALLPGPDVRPRPLPETVRPRSWLPWRSGEVAEFGADAVLVSAPKPLAGLGTSSQLVGVCDGLRRLARSNACRIGYVGPPLAGADPLLAAPFIAMEPTGSTQEIYRRCESAFTAAFTLLANAGCRRIVLACMGYTAFGPEAAKRAFRRVRSADLEQLLLLIVDSAFPDRDEPEVGIGRAGYPLGRFHEAAYAPDPGVRTAFLLTSAYRYDPAILTARAPAVSWVGLIAPPYTEGYIDALRNAGAKRRAGGTGELPDILPELCSYRAGDLLIPFVSSDIWSPTAIDAWMTRDQYQTVLTGTTTVLRGLQLVARRQGCRVFVPIDAAVLQILDRRFDDILLASSRGYPGGVRLVPYESLSQADHARLLGTADLAVTRTGAQANAFAVLSLVKTPSVVMDLPAAGYMQSELASAAVESRISISGDGVVRAVARERPTAWFTRWTWPASMFAEVINRILEDATESARRAEAARKAFLELFNSADGNLFAILERLAR
jgi:hypothetical protein